MSENNQSTQDKAPLKKLASAEELRGRRSGTDNSGKPPRKRKLWVPLVALCVVLAAAVGAYLYTQTLKPAEEVATDPAADYVDQTVKLIDSSRSEVASVTVGFPQRRIVQPNALTSSACPPNDVIAPIEQSQVITLPPEVIRTEELRSSPSFICSPAM